MDKEREHILLKQLGSGNRKAFDALYLHYYPKLKGFLTGLMKNEEEAKDIAQDIFLKVWINRESIARIEYFSSYLYNMAKNALFDIYEHELVKEKYFLSIKDLPEAENLTENELYAKELEDLINLSVTTMPKQRREIFLMSRKDGMSNQEIADKLKISKRTIENHITLALKKLREIINTFIILFF